MPKNALFVLKNRKNRRALGAPPPYPLLPAAFAPKTPQQLPPWWFPGYASS